MFSNRLVARNQGGNGHYAAASVVAAAVTLLGLAMIPFSGVQLEAFPGFMPAFGGLVLLTDALTAGLLIIQSQLPGHRPPCLYLGAAYLFSAMAIVPHLLAFPGVLAAAPIIGGRDTAVWLWCAWHGGFALFVLRYILAGGTMPTRGAVPRMVATVTLAVVGLTIVAASDSPWLPTLLQAGSFVRLNTTGIGPAVLGLTLTAAILVVTRLRLRDVVSTWLAVAMLAAALDVALTLSGSGRYTLGWYAARLLSLATGVTVLFSCCPS